MPDGTVQDNAERHRYEITVQGELAGFVKYRLDDGAVVLVHTEIEPDFEGQGLGGQLARGALDDVRRQGKAVIAVCPFIAGYIDRHDEYADLVRSP
jgi:uncharacterized protein